jgi:hypothetical protein
MAITTTTVEGTQPKAFDTALQDAMTALAPANPAAIKVVITYQDGTFYGWIFTTT